MGKRHHSTSLHMASPKAESNLGSSDPEAYEEVIFGDRSVCTWEVMQSRKQDKSISGCTIKVTIKTAEAQYRLEFWGVGQNSLSYPQMSFSLHCGRFPREHPSPTTHTCGFGAAQAGSETSLRPNARESWWARHLINCDTFKNVCVS